MSLQAQMLGLDPSAMGMFMNSGGAAERYRILAETRATMARGRANRALNSVAKEAPTTSKEPPKDLEPGEAFSEFVAALVAGEGDCRQALGYASKSGLHPYVQSALKTADGDAGGVLVPQQIAADFVETLRPRSVVRAMGARTVKLTSGRLAIPAMSSGATLAYYGEDDSVPVTQPTFSDVVLTERECGGLVPISSKLIRHASHDVMSLVKDDLVRAAAQLENESFLRGSGTGAGPKGLRYWAPSGNIVSSDSDYNLFKVRSELVSLVLALAGNDVPMERCGWVMSPRSYFYLKGLSNTSLGDGTRAFPELDGDMLFGFPVAWTSSMPSNLGTGSDETEIILADFDQIVVGEGQAVKIATSDTAMYSSGGSDISAFSRNQTLVRITMSHDIVPRYESAIAVLTGVKWGA